MIEAYQDEAEIKKAIHNYEKAVILLTEWALELENIEAFDREIRRKREIE